MADDEDDVGGGSANRGGGEKRRAVALRYDAPKDTAPVVTAKGTGFIADKILELAREHGVPIQQNRVLVQALSILNLEQEIPAEAYRAVAEILAFLYRLDRPSR